MEVRHLMSHTSGVSGWDQPVMLEDIYDRGDVHRLARRPGAVVGAGHRLGIPRDQPGHLVGEVVRRITGTLAGTFFADEIAGPLDADFQIGLRAAKTIGRIAG